jgi:hypothetical protein
MRDFLNSLTREEAKMKMFLGKLFCCRFEFTFYAIPTEVTNPSALACLGKTSESATPSKVSDASL